jgi:hypothetical protein
MPFAIAGSKPACALFHAVPCGMMVIGRGCMAWAGDWGWGAVINEKGEVVAIEFPVDKDVGEPAFRFVHPRRQVYVKALIDNLPRSVDELWVYGSAVTPDHYSMSDLDVLILGDGISRDERAALDQVMCRTALDLDTWNERRDVNILYDTKSGFDSRCDEHGHLYYAVKHDGLKYYDRRWEHGKPSVGHAAQSGKRS